LIRVGDEPFILQPHTFCLGSTVEAVTLPDDIVARVDGKSSLGRLGLLVHATAGYVDPGWTGQLTLELSNQSQMPIALYYGMRIAQISFLRLPRPPPGPTDRPARLKVPGTDRPTASRISDEFNSEWPQIRDNSRRSHRRQKRTGNAPATSAYDSAD
jgi:dCTP deaminase